MALNLSRWMNYAKTRIESAVGQGNRSLDRLEAERESEQADKPWLRSDGDAPTLDEARARIEWEAERQRIRASADRSVAPESAPRPAAAPTPGAESPAADPPVVSAQEPAPAVDTETGAEVTDAPAIPASSDDRPSAAGPPLRSPEEVAADAEAEQARIEWEARQQASAQRLDDIRRELGVDAPPPVEGPKA